MRLTRIVTPLTSFHFLPKRKKMRCDVILECHDGDRSSLVDGMRYSPILDSIRGDLESIGYVCISLAKPGSKYTVDAHGGAISAFSAIDEIIYLFLKIFDRVFGDHRGYAFIYINFVYRRLIKLYNPILVIGIQPSRELVSHCNTVNLPVVDVLHGYGIVPTHHVYGFDAIVNTPDNQLCTDYIALDEISKRQIEASLQCGHKNSKVWSIVSPVLDASKPFQNCNIDHSVYSKYKKVCLVTLQWGIDRFEQKFPHEDGELHPKIHRLVCDFKVNDVLFIIKLHPMIAHNDQIKHRLITRYSKQDNVIVDTSSTLYRLLLISDVHLTIFSTSVREAAFLGISSLLFSTDDELFSDGNDRFQAELEHGIARRVGYYSHNRILDIILNINKITQLPSTYIKNVMPSNQSICTIVQSIIRKVR